MENTFYTWDTTSWLIKLLKFTQLKPSPSAHTPGADRYFSNFDTTATCLVELRECYRCLVNLSQEAKMNNINGTDVSTTIKSLSVFQFQGLHI